MASMVRRDGRGGESVGQSMRFGPEGGCSAPGTSTPTRCKGQPRDEGCWAFGEPARAAGASARAALRRRAAWPAAALHEQFQKGYVLPQGALEQIPIGASQDQVLIVLGTPSTVATLDGEVFYYISERAERKVAFMKQEVIDQRVIAVYFGKNRHVTRLANYGLQDGKVFDFITRTTPTSGQEMNYLTPLLKVNPLRGMGVGN